VVEDSSKTPDATEARLIDVATDSDLVIAYLLYALKDVRALSERSTQLLEGAIATLIEETREQHPVPGERPRARARRILC
jgi:hypothetical protein